MPDDEASRVREAIRDFMQDNGISQNRLAPKLDMSQPALSDLLAGVNNPSDQTARRFAKLAGLPERFWEQRPDNYPADVVDAVEELQERFSGLGFRVAADLVRAIADTIADTGRDFDGGLLADLASPVIRWRLGIEAEGVPDHAALNRPSNGHKPHASRVSKKLVTGGHVGGVRHDSVDIAARPRKKARQP
jgi:transcriptional regulator with XRE-family HTH domain